MNGFRIIFLLRESATQEYIMAINHLNTLDHSPTQKRARISISMREKQLLTHPKGHRRFTKRKTRLPDSFQRRGQNATKSPGSASSRSGEKIRLEIEFHQTNKIVNALIQADIHLQVTANEGTRRTDYPQNKTSQSQKRLFP